MISTEKYDLDYDSAKNRILFKVKGLWPSVSDVPNFDRDWKKITRGIPKGFTALADLTEMQPFPQDVADLNEKKQQELMAIGCAKVAYVTNSQIVSLQVKRVSKTSGMSGVIKGFDSQKEAAAWLDFSSEVQYE